MPIEDTELSNDFNQIKNEKEFDKNKKENLSDWYEILLDNVVKAGIDRISIPLLFDANAEQDYIETTIDAVSRWYSKREKDNLKNQLEVVFCVKSVEEYRNCYKAFKKLYSYADIQVENAFRKNICCDL